MITPYYTILYTKLENVVSRIGWRLTLYGSMLRDLDLVLIPWGKDAVSEDIVLAEVCSFIRDEYITLTPNLDKKTIAKCYLTQFRIAQKPHGRRSLIIRTGYSKCRIILSIMPRKE